MDQLDTQYQVAAATPLQARVALAFGQHDYDWNQKQAYFKAIEGLSDDELDSMTWEKLPQAAREAIEAVEREPRSTWEDPTEVPDDTSYLDS